MDCSGDDNATAITAAGLEWVPFIWMHNLPPWVRNGSAHPRARCLEHHLDSEGSLSIFDSTTTEAYERFFEEFAGEFGSVVRHLRFDKATDITEKLGLARSIESFLDRAADYERRIADR